ncbi:MAG: AMP-binding protein [Candidatus Obscuribacterales bacterium]|nr:AMP-binding protein [Candidatus Obscuribacterales bacterium]
MGLSQLKQSPLIQLFFDACREHPQKTFLVFGSHNYSYSDIQHKVSHLSEKLARQGLRKGDRVAIYLFNSPEFVVSFLALNNLGITVVPVNPLLKEEEIEHILHDSQARALITQREMRNGETKFSKNLKTSLELSLDLMLELNENQAYSVAPESLGQDLDSASAALIVYTSGTTGKPKGAVLSYGNVAFTIQSYPLRFCLNQDDILLGVLPLCHLYGLLVVLAGAMKAGCGIVLMKQFDAAAALLLIRSEAVSVLPAVPTMHQFILMELDKEGKDSCLDSLRLCTTGGAAMPKDLLVSLKERLKVPVLEGYALTETTVIATLNPEDDARLGSVGSVFPGIEIAIEKDGIRFNSSSVLERTEVGEILLKGACIMKGYFNNAAATAEVIKDGWFYTGDLGYLDAEGYLYIVGRSKELIVRGGMNIYPREIEEVLLRLPAVAECAVVGVPDRYMGERVKACIVLRSGASLSEDEIKSFCKAHLADYKMPRTIEFLERLPRNSTGKVLKRLLC